MYVGMVCTGDVGDVIVIENSYSASSRDSSDLMSESETTIELNGLQAIAE